eukprot:3654070-Pleurochrysis_carterae.AAC.1
MAMMRWRRTCPLSVCESAVAVMRKERKQHGCSHMKNIGRHASLCKDKQSFRGMLRTRAGKCGMLEPEDESNHSQTEPQLLLRLARVMDEQESRSARSLRHRYFPCIAKYAAHYVHIWDAGQKNHADGRKSSMCCA